MSQGIQKLTVGVDRGIVGRSIAIVPSTILQEDHLVEVEVLDPSRASRSATGWERGHLSTYPVC